MTHAIELADVHKRFGATRVLSGVSLAVEKGERHAVIGPNGAGKSTLFNLVSGRDAPTHGTIRLHGAEVTGLPPHALQGRGLARSFQVTNVFPGLTVYDNLRCATLRPLGHGYAFWKALDGLRDVAARAEETLARIGLANRRDAPAGALSYAEQRALEIGITIAGGADVILLDEPTAGMNRSETGAAVALIREVTRGRTLLMVEHDMAVVFDLADRITVLAQGEVVATGAPAEIRANAAVREAYLGALDD